MGRPLSTSDWNRWYAGNFDGDSFVGLNSLRGVGVFFGDISSLLSPSVIVDEGNGLVGVHNPFLGLKKIKMKLEIDQ